MRETRLQTTLPLRLHPTPEQVRLLRAHAQEYISTVNVMVAAIDSGVLPNDGNETTTADFTAALPSAVKNQALRDARSVWKRSLVLGRVPVLRRPVCQWNNQNWRVAQAPSGDEDRLLIPVSQAGQVGRIAIRCAGALADLPPGSTPGLLRITRKRGKWIADVAYTLPDPPAAPSEAVMGVDLGIKVPAVVHVIGRGTRYLGNGRSQRARRRQFYARRRALQQAKKVRAVRKSRGKEARWMCDTNHKLSHQVVAHAQQQGVGAIRLERLAGIRQQTVQRTTRPSGGAKRTPARKNNRMLASWPFYQLATFIAYKAARAGMAVEWVDPAYTSRTCPACSARNAATDRRYVCGECGWMGHRDAVGAINISRRTTEAGLAGYRQGATGA
jgi:IS605 OrfB family transposase